MRKNPNYIKFLLIFILLFSGSYLLFWKIKQDLPVVGTPIDSLNAVVVYYNGSIKNVAGRNLSKDGYNLGLKYQCVEFVKRYYYQFLKHKMPDSYGHAKDFFLLGLKDGVYNKQRNLIQFTNPSAQAPQVNDLLVFDGNLFNPYGHVAIVSKVENDQIEIIQQNAGKKGNSREFISIRFADSKWEIERKDLLGWLRLKKEL